MAADAARLEELVESISARLVRLEAISNKAEENKAAEDAEAVGSFTEEQIQVFKQAFDNFDGDSTGEISPTELGDVCKMLGTPVEAQMLEKIMDEVDENSDGVVDFPEFLGMMRKIISNEGDNEGVGAMKMKTLSHYGREALLRWIRNDPNELDGDVTGPAVSGPRRGARRLLMNRMFEWMIYFVILLAAVLSGVQTYPAFHNHIVIETIEHASLIIFIVEIVIKLMAESAGKTHHFFKDGWNTFDFIIVFFLAAMIPFSNGQYDAVRLVRLLRAFRLLKATRVLPKLGLVVETLITSASSVMYIAMFLMLIGYIFAIIGTGPLHDPHPHPRTRMRSWQTALTVRTCTGTSTFRYNDPFHFGNLGTSMLTLFRMSTLDDWTDIMYANMYGCDWGDYIGTVSRDTKPCESEKFGLASVAFCVAFVTLSSFLMLNLFIGVITGAMAEAKDEMYRRKKENARLALAQRMRGKTKRREEKAAKQAAEEMSRE